MQPANQQFAAKVEGNSTAVTINNESMCPGSKFVLSDILAAVRVSELLPIDTTH